MKKVLATLVLCISFLAVRANAGNIIVGLPADSGTGNCFPFGCAYTTEYQQVYTSSLFSSVGTIDITDLEFYNTQIDLGATTMNSGNWAISLSTTAADWNTISSTYAANIGANNTLVFNGNLAQAWAFGDALTINLTTPFLYNPAMGNLLMDVVATNTSDANGIIYFDTNGYNGGNFNGNTIFGRVYCNGCGITTGVVNNGYGLVTGFSYGTTTTPEPTSMFLLGTALVGLAGKGLRKLRK